MPLSRHTVGEFFDIDRSEVVAWIMAQPGFKLWVFEKAKNTERIVFDRESMGWRGVQRKTRRSPVLVDELPPDA